MIHSYKKGNVPMT